jgi:hypothetical protein
MRIINFPNFEGFHLFCKITRFFATEPLHVLHVHRPPSTYPGTLLAGRKDLPGKSRFSGQKPGPQAGKYRREDQQVKHRRKNLQADRNLADVKTHRSVCKSSGQTHFRDPLRAKPEIPLDKLLRLHLVNSCRKTCQKLPESTPGGRQEAA